MNGKIITVRCPIIPNFNDTAEHLENVAKIATDFGIKKIDLLPFHQYGEPKYRLLGKTWSMKEVSAPSSADVATMREMAERAGFQVTVGG